MSHATLRLVSLVLFVIAAMLVSVSVTSASTEIIIDDTYTAANGTAIPTHQPDVNLPGHDPNLAAGNYYTAIHGSQGIGGGVGLGSAGYPISTTNVARVGGDSGFAINLATPNGGYTKPTTFTVSADLNLEGQESSANTAADIENVGNVGAIGGIALGFYPSAAAGVTADRDNILGVVYSDAGKLLLVELNGSLGSGTDIVRAVVTTYQPGNVAIPLTGTHNLSYTVNTTSGGISNVTFDGFPITFSYTSTAFTNTATYYVGQFSRSGFANDFGTFDNLLVTTELPEPASLCLLSAGGLLLLRRHRDRGRVAA